jgi:hypothetical protein
VPQTHDVAERIDPDFLDLTVTIRRPIDGGVDIFREFTASFEYAPEDDEVEIAVVRGWIGWGMAEEDIHDAADAISADSEILGAAAAEIVKAHADLWLDTVVLVDRMSVEPEFRGQRLSGTLIRSLLAFMRLQPDDTVVVLQPEPQKPGGGPIDDPAERAKALARLTSAYRESGFEPWNDSDVWWLPFRDLA